MSTKIRMLTSRYIPGIGAKAFGDTFDVDQGLARQMCDDQRIAERVRVSKPKSVSEEK